jgi:hypothetical protein
MTSDDADVPSDTAGREHGLRNCEKCNAEMKQLGVLPALSIRAAVSVFRCYACDHVFAERI